MRFDRITALVACLALSACGGDSGTPTEPPPPPADPKPTASIAQTTMNCTMLTSCAFPATATNADSARAIRVRTASTCTYGVPGVCEKVVATSELSSAIEPGNVAPKDTALYFIYRAYHTVKGVLYTADSPELKVNLLTPPPTGTYSVVVGPCVGISGRPITLKWDNDVVVPTIVNTNGSIRFFGTQVYLNNASGPGEVTLDYVGTREASWWDGNYKFPHYFDITPFNSAPGGGNGMMVRVDVPACP